MQLLYNIQKTFELHDFDTMTFVNYKEGSINIVNPYTDPSNLKIQIENEIKNKLLAQDILDQAVKLFSKLKGLFPSNKAIISFKTKDGIRLSPPLIHRNNCSYEPPILELPNHMLDSEIILKNSLQDARNFICEVLETDYAFCQYCSPCLNLAVIRESRKSIISELIKLKKALRDIKLNIRQKEKKEAKRHKELKKQARKQEKLRFRLTKTLEKACSHYKETILAQINSNGEKIGPHFTAIKLKNGKIILASGYGKFMGEDYVIEYSNVKFINRHGKELSDQELSENEKCIIKEGLTDGPNGYDQTSQVSF